MQSIQSVSATVPPQRLVDQVDQEQQVDVVGNVGVVCLQKVNEETKSWSIFQHTVTVGGLFNGLDTVINSLGVVKNGAIYLAKEVAKTSVQVYVTCKKNDAKLFLSSLVGQSKLDTFFEQSSSFLNQLLKFYFSKEIDDHSEGDAELIPQLISGILPYIIKNLAVKAFPRESAIINSGQNLDLKESISLERFQSGIFHLLFQEIFEELRLMDKQFTDIEKIETKDFEALAKKILELVLPPSGKYQFQATLENINLTSYLKKFLEKGLHQLFLYGFGVTKDKKNEEGALPKSNFLETFTPFLQSAIGPLARSISKAFVEEDENYLNPQIKEGLEFFIEPFVMLLTPFIKELDPLLLGVNSEDLKWVVKAFIFRVFVNILPSEDVTGSNPLNVGECFFDYFQKNLFENMQLIQGKKSKHYLPLFTEMFKKVCSKDPNISEFLLKRFPIIAKSGSNFLFELHSALKKDDVHLYGERLRTFLWDEELFRKMHPTIQDIPSHPTPEVSEMLGSEKLIRQLKTLTLNIGDVCMGLILQSIQPDHMHKYIEFFYVQADKKERATYWLKSISEFLLKKDTGNLNVQEYIKKWIADTLFKMLVNLIQRGSKAEDSIEKSFYHGMQLFLQVFQDHSSNIQKHLDDVKTRSNLSFGVFQELSRDLLLIFCDPQVEKRANFEHFLPIPEFIGKKISQKTEESFLPKLLMNLYCDFHKEIFQKEQTREKLKEIYHNDRMSSLSEVLSHYAEQFIPYFFRDSADMLTDLIIDNFSDWLLLPVKDGIEQKPSETPSKAAQFNMLRNMLRTFFIQSGNSNHPVFKMLWGFVSEYIEAFLLQRFLGLSVSIEQVESDYKKSEKCFYKGSLQLKTMTFLMEEAKEHLARINSLKRELNVSHASLISHNQMVQYFDGKNKLHDALKNDKSESRFYENIKPKLLSIFQLDRESGLAASSFLKEPLWYLVVDLLFPLLSQVLIKLAMSPESLNTYLNSLLTQINRSLKLLDSKEVPLENPMPSEVMNHQIESIAGDLIAELIGLHPTLAEILMHYRPLKVKAGKVVGEAIRSAAERKTFLEFIDLLVQSTLPSLHPGGGWITSLQYRSFLQTESLPSIDLASEGDIFFPISTNSEGDKVKGYDFKFPKNEQQKSDQINNSLKSNIKNKKDVEKQLAEMIQQQAILSIDATSKGVWHDMQKSFDLSVKENFGPLGLKVKTFLDKLGRILWKYFFQPFFKVIGYPYKELILFILKKYFASQARRRVTDIDSPIHENFLLLSFEKFILLISEGLKANS